MPAFGKGLIGGAAAAVGDVPVGIATEEIAKGRPEVALPLNIGLGVLSGATVEKLIERKLGKVGPKISKRAMRIGKKIIDSPPIDSKQIDADYNELKDIWIGNKNVDAYKATVQAKLQQNDIVNTTGEVGKITKTPKFKKLSQDIDKAIQIHIDLKRNPDHLTRFFDDLSPEQQRIVTLSQNLTPEQIAIAEGISRQYQEVGQQALDSEVIRNTLDNYVARAWDVEPPKHGTEKFRKFGTATRHAKARKFETILEGWANGFNLKIEGATNNLQILKEEISKTIADKTFLNKLSKLKNLEGKPLITTDATLPGYVRIDHPNFKAWRVGAATDAPIDPTRGKNFLQIPEGTILERKEFYAPKEIAKELNNIFGVSGLKDVPSIKEITKANAVIKAWVLQSSFFHHTAFMRSFYLGSSPFGEAFGKIKSGESFIDAVKGLTPRQAYKSGLKAITDMQPEIELLVRNGLTLGKMQDWEESILRNEQTFIGKTLDKLKVSKVIKDKINAFREAQADFLFKQFGTGLKAKAALIEYKNILKKRPGIDPNKAAKIAANLMNDDFGGLHLQRIGRSPTTQHIFRLFALAPDWTESNIRSLVKAFKKGDEGEVYRKFWARIVTKSMAATLIANVLLHGDGTIESYKKAWEAGKLSIFDIDITPIYKLLGGKTDARKFFSLIGHFKDPLKFAVNPIKSARYKASPIYSMVHDLLTGEDWAGRQFTSFEELLATGETVRPPFTFGRRPSGLSTVPSFILNKIRSTQPVQIQKLFEWWQGETEAFDAIGQSLGIGIGTTFIKSKKQKEREKAVRKAIKGLRN